MRRASLAAAVLALLPAAPPARAGDVDYVRDVKPLLAEKCNACHGALKQKAGLRLDAAPLLRAGGDNGPVVVPGKADESLLVHAVTGAHGVERMPLEGSPLTDAQVATLRAWIDGGAAAPDEPTPPSPAEHWAFRPPVRPEVPPVRDAAWVRNPVDAFVAAERERRGLVPAAEAPPHVLLRRVYLDLTGLPPTRDELRAFLDDSSPHRYERVVDALLASPRYGERWGRHWMDVWRYSDWAGYQAQVRESQPFVWRWRDWIVESLNADRPYDRMVQEMLAGDELEPADPQTLRATGYLARSWYKFNRNVWLDNTVEHAGKAFLGLTFNCARCHDHKYDPVSQKDYYRLRAFFEPLNVRADPVPGQPDVTKDGLARAYDADAAAPTFLFVRGDEKQPDKSEPLAAGTPAVLGALPVFEAVPLPTEAYAPASQAFVQRDARAAADAAVEQARADLGKARANASTQRATTRPATTQRTTTRPAGPVELATLRLAAAEAERASVEARIGADLAKLATRPSADAASLALAAGAAERRAALCKAEAALLAAEQQAADARASAKPRDEKAGKAAEAKEKAVASARAKRDAAREAAAKPSPTYTPLAPTYPATSTGRRLALARWVTSDRNPLAARVAVNHIWMRHLGEPLVPTVFDFGLHGKPPTHPALLDWLATELVREGWRTKQVHRLIVTSSTYRMHSAAAADDPNSAADPDNRFLWRFNGRRLEAEAVRDGVLHAAGQLDPTAGGPDLDPAAAMTVPRRSLYFRHANEKQAAFLLAFDAASPAECYRRAESVVPQQALAMANSPLTVAQSRLLAAALTTEAGGDAAFIAAAFERVLCRPPTGDEAAACLRFLPEQAERLADPKALESFSSGEAAAAVQASADSRQRARENLVHVLFNHNDFVTLR